MSRGLFAEIKRRNVVRVAAAYAVIAWLLVQAADILLSNFGAPVWVFKSFAALLVLGFPLALFLSWAYELTPEGVKRSEQVPASQSLTPKTGKRIDRVILVGALAVIVVLVIERVWFAGSPPERPEPVAAEAGSADQTQTLAQTPARSIAVLAFDDLSPDRDQAYFAEGVSEELLNLLARVDGFKVAARTSSFKFRGANLDIGEIGRALGVEAVLEGSVRKSGDQVRVTAQLINVGDGFHLWSSSYDRRLDNIFAVQDEIAGAIVEALKLELDISAATAGRTDNTEAYDLYLRGRQEARVPTRAGLLRAIELYEQAIGLDPRFASAFAGIADAWVWLEDYGGFRSAEAFPRAEQAARRALELDPESAEAHAAMAFVRDRYYRDKTGAIEHFERTLELNPNHVNAWNLYGDTLRDVGNYKRMIEVHRRAVELDPLSVFMRTRLASKLMMLGEFEEAEAIIEEVFAGFPDDDFAREELANLRRDRGQLAEALVEFRSLHFARPGDPFAAAQMALIAVELDQPELARAWIAVAREQGADNRWELSARLHLAEWQEDWDELGRVTSRIGGDVGATYRARAAIQLGQWAEARQHLIESLQIRGLESEHGLHASATPELVQLAWVERELGLTGWESRLAWARPILQGMIDSGFDAFVSMARLELMEGNPAAALDVLRRQVELRWLAPWILERDPILAGVSGEPEFVALIDEMRTLLETERAKLAGLEVMP